MRDGEARLRERLGQLEADNVSLRRWVCRCGAVAGDAWQQRYLSTGAGHKHCHVHRGVRAPSPCMQCKAAGQADHLQCAC